eukprot:SAG22_NODE_6927_length_794_cov_1.328058_1_plen_91_part_00
MPNAEFLAPWFNERMPKSMPREIYDTLSDHAKDTCRRIVAEPGEQIPTGYIDWGWSKAAATMAEWMDPEHQGDERGFDAVPGYSSSAHKL